MKKLVRYYSLGLLTSAGLLLAVYLFTTPSEGSVSGADTEEMINLLKDKGYAVLTQEEYIKLSVAPEGEAENEAAEETAAVETTEQQEIEKEANESPEKEAEAADKDDDNQEEEEKKDEPAENEGESSVIRFKLNITPGMASSDVSSLLANESIIGNASEFNSYLDEHGYSQNVQQGTFDLTSEMSFYEIAERIAR